MRMMMQRYIKIPIPTWMPTETDLGYFWRTVKYKLNPYRCTSCNVRMDFKRPEYMGKVSSGSRLGISNTKDSLCPICLLVEIKRHFDTLPKNQKHLQCECCKETNKTVDIIWGLSDDTSKIDVRFLTNWWNGHEICLDCITEALTDPTATSSVMYSTRGKTYYINEKRALINVGHNKTS